MAWFSLALGAGVLGWVSLLLDLLLSSFFQYAGFPANTSSIADQHTSFVSCKYHTRSFPLGLLLKHQENLHKLLLIVLRVISACEASMETRPQ